MLHHREVSKKHPTVEKYFSGHWRDVVEETMCPPLIFVDESWHALGCVLGKCERCGVSELKRTLEGWDDRSQLCFKLYECATFLKRNGEESKRTTLVSKNTTFLEFIEIYLKHISIIRQHDFEARWLDMAIKLRRKKRKPHCLSVTPDFQENCHIKFNIEVQSEHYANTNSVTIHTAPIQGSWNDGQTFQKVFLHMSDIMQHCPNLVKHCLTDIIISVRSWEGHSPVTELQVSSDGCRSQYKGSKALYGNTMLCHELNVTVDHWVTAAGHGKTSGDGHGGNLKNRIRREAMKDEAKSKIDRSNPSLSQVNWNKSRKFPHIRNEGYF